MRIVGGIYRGRTLITPAGEATRPTSDRAREAVFNVLEHAAWSPGVRERRAIDLFAGSGALGLEALSRGAAQATFMENDRSSLATLRANIAACGAQDRCRVLAVDVLTAPLGSPSGLVFLDPPYGAALVPQAMARLRASGWVAPCALVVAETGRGDAPPALGELLAERVHGAARVSIWREAK